MISESAPGKVILFGEHAVVFGYPAIAAPLDDVKASVEIQTLPDDSTGRVFIEAPDLQFQGWLHETPKDDPIAFTINSTLRHIGNTAFSPFRIRISSVIPTSAGLGSGAAVSTAIVKTVARYLDVQLSASEISDIVFSTEKLHHGTPSGIDNTVIAHGRSMVFQRNQPPDFLEFHEPLWIVLGDTGERTPTAIAVNHVRKYHEREPQAAEDHFREIEDIVASAKDILLHGPLYNLGPLMNSNQTILEQLGVSSLRLDRVIQASRDAGALGAKLTGGGMGGFAIAHVVRDSIETVQEAMAEAGAIDTHVSKIGS